MFVLIGIVAVTICALAFLTWWSSGRTPARPRLDGPAALADVEAAARSERTGLHPGSPGAGL